jgi:hypothetical protein
MGLLTVEDKLSCIVAARWVADQLDELEDIVPAVVHLLETMIVNLRARSEPLFIFETWFEFGLEVLIIPPCASCYALVAQNTLFKDVSPEALRCLGAAIKREMVRTGNDLLAHDDDGGAEVLIFLHNARSTVRLATGIVLPHWGLW